MRRLDRMLLRLLFVLLAVVLVGAKAPPQLVLSVEIVDVRPERLLVQVRGYAELRDGERHYRPERSGVYAVLVPGGKCAVGDRFEVVARDAGMAEAKETSPIDQPLRKYSVTTAKRL